MSLVSQIQAAFSRVATEFNNLRSEKVNYSKIDNTLKGSTSNDTKDWDLSVAGIITCALSTSNTITLTGYQKGTVKMIKLTNSGGATQTLPGVEFWGDPVGTDGVFYITIECWDDTPGSELVLITSRKSKA